MVKNECSKIESKESCEQKTSCKWNNFYQLIFEGVYCNKDGDNIVFAYDTEDNTPNITLEDCVDKCVEEANNGCSLF